MTTISLICPTRGRPQQLRRMWDSARKTAADDSRIILRFGIRHEEQAEYAKVQDGMSSMYVMHDFPTVHCSNMIGERAMDDQITKLFFMVGDDAVFTTPHWDKALREHYEALENKIHVYSLLDSRDPNGTPHPIVTREYIKAIGFFMPPIFLHWYADSWTVDIAKSSNCFTHIKDYMLFHDKPSDRGQPDETHNRIRKMGWNDRDAYVAKSCVDWLAIQKSKLAYRIGAKQCSAA